MKIKLTALISVILVFGFVGCSHPNSLSKKELSSIEFLNHQDVNNIFVNKRIKGLYYKYNSNFDLSFNADGTYKGDIYYKGKEYPTSGKWFVKDDKNCFIIKRGEYCAKYFKKDGKYYTISLDTLEKVSEFTVVN